MLKKKFLILGAGIAGLSAARQLDKKGADYRILEKDPIVGGLCCSKQINGFTFDCSGHLLHFKRRESFDLIKHLLPDNLLVHKRSAWVYTCGRYIPYPFQANLHGLPPRVSKECVLGFINARRYGCESRNRKDPGFLNWINLTFGKGIARHFMVPYNRKFWTLDPRDLTCEWLDGVIPVPSLEQLIEGTVEDSKRQFGYNARFWYPKNGGISRLISALSNETKNISTGSKVVGIDLDKKEVVTASGIRQKYDYLISTIPLPELPGMIKSLPAEISKLFNQLQWNSIFNLNLGIKKHDNSSRHWMYFPQKEICFFRVGFYHNFVLSRPGEYSLYAEVSYPKNGRVNKSEMIRKIRADLLKTGILDKTDQICAEDVNDIKYGYPIYDRQYKRSREGILGFLAKNNIFSCGRYGSWRYMSMEDALLDGANLAMQLWGDERGMA